MTTYYKIVAVESASSMSKLDKIFDEELHDSILACSRVWEAWQYGTMTQDDFTPAIEETEWVDEFKQQIKDLMLELISEDEFHGGYQNEALEIAFDDQIKMERNDVRAELRQKVNEL